MALIILRMQQGWIFLQKSESVHATIRDSRTQVGCHYVRSFEFFYIWVLHSLESIRNIGTLDLLVKFTVRIGLFLGTFSVGDWSRHQALLFSAIHEILIESFLLLSNQSFLEGHFVLSVEHISLLLQVVGLVVVIAKLVLLLLQLLHPTVLHFIILASLLIKIISGEVVQDLLLQLQALMADESFLLGVPGHAPKILTHSICNQVGLVAVKRGAMRCWLHLLGNRHEELLGR